MDWLVQVGGLLELVDEHGLLLDVVLREEAWLTGHHLLDGSRDQQIIHVIIRPSWLPAFRRNNLEEKKTEKSLIVKWSPAQKDSRSCRHNEICMRHSLGVFFFSKDTLTYRTTVTKVTKFQEWKGEKDSKLKPHYTFNKRLELRLHSSEVISHCIP